MAKMNKTEATDALLNASYTNSEILDVQPAVMRLMDGAQLQLSAARAFETQLEELMLSAVQERYHAHVKTIVVDAIARSWRQKIHAFEDSDPACLAEREARGFLFTLEHMMMEAGQTLKKFEENLAKNPFYAFENSRHAMQAAADMQVAMRAQKALKTQSVPEVKKALVESLRYADGLRLDGSTCPTTNLMARAETIATVRLAGLRS